MKKGLVMALLLTAALSMTACVPFGNRVPDRPAPEAEEEVVPDETEEEAEKEEEKETPAANGDTKDLAEIASQAVDASATTDADPVPMGQWAEMAIYATEDSAYHTVYVRMTDVTTQTEDGAKIQEMVDLHNSVSYDFQQIDLSQTELPSDVELCVVEYEIAIPVDFPAPEYGISDPSLMISESNIGGGGIPSADGTSTYIGMGSNNEDLAMEEDPVFEPGNVYSFRNLFTMVKGYGDYVFQITSYPDGTSDTSADLLYTANFASK